MVAFKVVLAQYSQIVEPWHVDRASRFSLRFVVDSYLAAAGFGKKQAVSNGKKKKKQCCRPLKKTDKRDVYDAIN